jgi:hypothetical protein
MRIKASLPLVQRHILSKLVPLGRGIAAQSVLRHMPVRLVNSETVGLVSTAMGGVAMGVHTSPTVSELKEGVAMGGRGLFSIRDFYQHDSAESPIRMDDELQNTNLLQLAEIAGGIFVLLDHPKL